MPQHIPKDFLVGDVWSADGKARHIILSTPDQRKQLVSKKVLYIDGTFSVSINVNLNLIIITTLFVSPYSTISLIILFFHYRLFVSHTSNWCPFMLMSKRRVNENKFLLHLPLCQGVKKKITILFSKL